MSPGSKKSKKLSTRAAKEQAKVSAKSTNLHANGGKSAPTSAYNPALGTFHTIEISTSAPVLTMQKNAQLIIDETEEQSLSSPGTVADYDSVSNNDSFSGESEDHKEKATTSTIASHSDSIPVPGSDADKRDKIRQKNERKHQRQKEKRAQELHMRCTGYLMSCKLEALAQQLVAMGFSSQHAAVALIANEGRMEESVAWLLQESEQNSEHVKPNPEDRARMKLDISEELAKIAGLEKKYKCSKQEVERAVVACEGDLVKAEDNLKAQKQELVAAAGNPKVEGACEPTRWNDKMAVNSGQNPMMRSQGKGAPSFSNQQQQRVDERNLNYTKAAGTGTMFQESVDRNLQSLRTQQLPNWVRAQVAAAAAIEKGWPSTSSSPSVSNPLRSTLQFPMPLATSDSQHLIINNEVKANIQAGSLREKNFAMQCLPSMVNTKRSSTSTSISVGRATGWYTNGISNMELMASSANDVGCNLQNTGLSGFSPPQFYPRSHSQSFISNSLDSASARQSGSWNLTGNSLVSPFTSASLAAPASLGLFSGWGSLGSTNSVDWSSDGSFPQRDYRSIDWSLDLTQLRPSVSDTWPTMMMGEKARARSVMYFPGLQDSSSLVAKASSSAASREWTTPFAGKDLFGVPRRQFVASPL